MATKTKVTTEIKTVTDEKLHDAIRQKLEYKRIKEEAEAIIKQLDAEIKAAVEDSGENQIICGEYKVTLSKYVRETVSASKVKKFVSDEVFEQVVSRTMTTKLTVS